MSGGVDSSVAAWLIKGQGYDAAGITLNLTGTASTDIDDARVVSEKISIPHYVYDLSDRFRECVIDSFIDAYIGGTTPNPCVECNRSIKFGYLPLYAERLGYDFIATGHYAVIEYNSDNRRYLLKKAADETKDQSYVLYTLTQQQLSRTLFPLGILRKAEVREIAEEYGFADARKKESQDICFVNNGAYASFIEQYTGKKFEPGSFINRRGEVLGTHKGIIRYTVGQHKGLGISSAEPLYVCELLPEENRIVLCSDSELYTKNLDAARINLIACDSITSPVKLSAKIRYRQKEQTATVEQIEADRLRLEFETPQRAVTKGQSVVLYDGNCVVGGGVII